MKSNGCASLLNIILKNLEQSHNQRQWDNVTPFGLFDNAENLI